MLTAFPITHPPTMQKFTLHLNDKILHNWNQNPAKPNPWLLRTMSLFVDLKAVLSANNMPKETIREFNFKLDNIDVVILL